MAIIKDIVERELWQQTIKTFGYEEFLDPPAANVVYAQDVFWFVEGKAWVLKKETNFDFEWVEPRPADIAPEVG